MKNERIVIISIAIVAILSVGFVALLSDEVSFSNDVKSLPYATWVPLKGEVQKSITKYKEKETYNGINLYNSRHEPRANLIDMNGKVLHKWQVAEDSEEVWYHRGWFTSFALPDGDLLAMRKDRELLRLDFNSKLKWKIQKRFHHEIFIGPRGEIFTLTRRDLSPEQSGVGAPILNDYIAIVSDDGELKEEISLFELVKKYISEKKYDEINEWLKDPENMGEVNYLDKSAGYRYRFNWPMDVLHANAVSVLHKDVAGCCKKGDLLVSLRELDLVLVYNRRSKKVVWQWGPGEISRQHHPRQLANGNFLIFDNGVSKEQSRIVELEPSQKKIVWQYTDKKFYSEERGSSQMLPNGNILVTDSNSARVFEVTRKGKVVWEFYNPEIVEDEDGDKKQAIIYRMLRLTSGEYAPLLNRLKQKQI